MKKKLLLAIGLLSYAPCLHATYVPLTISSGYSADVVVNGVGTGLTTTDNDVDGVSYAFVAQGWQQTTSSTPLTWGLPTSGVINSTVTTTPGLYFNLASYSSSNSVRLAANGSSATITFSNNPSVKNLYILATSGSGVSNFTGQINFTDGTNQPISTNILVPDWFNSTTQPVALQGFGRINRSTNALESSTTNPRLYQIEVAILQANQSKQIASLELTKTSASGTVINVFAVSAEIITTNDAGVSQLVSPVYFCPGTNDVKVKVKNYGNSVINNVQIQWQLDGVPQTPYNLTLPLDTVGGTGLNEREVTLGSHTFTGAPVVLKTWSTLPNGQADGWVDNDTLTTNLQAALSGTYTVNSALPTAGTNYAGFTALADALMAQGMCGPVVVNVATGSGPYTERFSLGNVPGSSATNTLRINGNGATIQYNNTATERQIITLSGTQYTRIDSLNIKTMATGYGWGVWMTNNCQYDSLTRCTLDLTSTTTTTSNNTSGIVASGSETSASTGGTNVSHCYIADNKLSGSTGTGGMYYGIIIYGDNSDNLIRNNEVKNFYVYGIYQYSGSGNVIENNLVHRSTKTSGSTFYGIYLNSPSSGNGSLTVRNNRIHTPYGGTGTSASSAYGIYSGYDATAAAPLLVYNNLIYNMNQSSTMYGIMMVTTPYGYFYHNTIDFSTVVSGTSANYGFYASGTNTGVALKNNIVRISAGSGGTKYGFYFSSTTAVPADQQQNNFYVNSTQSGTQNYGYYGTTVYATQTAFQTANPTLEVSSPAVDPQFAAPASGNFTPANTALIGTGQNLTAIVPEDINGISRNNPPTIGAFEVISGMDNAALPALINPSGNYCSGPQTVKVVVKNSGSNTISSVQINWSVNGVVQTPYSYTGTLVSPAAPSGNNTDTVVIGTAALNAGANTLVVWTSSPNGATDSDPTNDTLTTTLTPAVFALTATDDTVCAGGATTLSLSPATGYATNGLQWQESTDNGQTWTDIAGATTSTYVASGLAASTCFRVKILNGGTDCISPVQCITYTTVAVSATTPDSRCGTGTLTLGASASPGATIYWYTAATGGTAVGSGTTWTTPVLNATTTYYAEAAIGTSGSGCQSSRTAVVATVQDVPVVDLGPDTFLCPAATMPLNATVAGSGTYLWNTGATTAVININSTGTYAVTVTGTNGCMASDTVVISAGVNPTDVLPATATLCQGSTLILDAGNAGADYLWNTGATTQTLSVQTGGTYSVTITNAQGCSMTSAGTAVSTLPAPFVDLGNDTAICATASLTLNAGAGAATYIWNTGATSASINVQTAGTYDVQVTGINGCMTNDTIDVTLKPTPTDVLPATADLCQGSTLTLDAGNAGDSYLWNTGATTQTLSVQSGGTYSVTITNSEGCTRTSGGTVVTMHALPVVDLGPDTIICNNASYMLDAGNAGAVYAWNTGAATQTIIPTQTGSYSVAVTDMYTCLGTDTVQVSFYDNPTVSGFNFVPLFGQAAGLVRFTALNPQFVTAYHWDFGDGSAASTQAMPEHQYTQSGIYTVTLTVTNECGQMDTSLVIDVDLLATTVKPVQTAGMEISVYPNPVVNGALTVAHHTEGLRLQQIQVYTMLGVKVYERPAAHATQTSVSLDGLASGMYLLRVQTNQGTVVRKIEIVR